MRTDGEQRGSSVVRLSETSAINDWATVDERAVCRILVHQIGVLTSTWDKHILGVNTNECSLSTFGRR